MYFYQSKEALRLTLAATLTKFDRVMQLAAIARKYNFNLADKADYEKAMFELILEISRHPKIKLNFAQRSVCAVRQNMLLNGRVRTISENDLEYLADQIRNEPLFAKIYIHTPEEIQKHDLDILPEYLKERIIFCRQSAEKPDAKGPLVEPRRGSDKEQKASSNQKDGKAVSRNLVESSIRRSKAEGKTAHVVPFEWKPGDVILDLYEVRSVTEGFGENAREKDYHEGGFGRVYKVWHRTWRREMAVKSPRAGVFTTQKQKDTFTRECETWINLGLHAHIAACHYVRDLGGAPRVFSEYAVAGTLEDWIRSKRLYEGDKQVALARMLDAGIQFAWGLHYAHERGVIHQDVKPLNALMWDDETLKVTDFGLAGARQKAGITVQSGDPAGGSRSIMVSTGGMTPSHCSPEQAAGRQLDRRTDVWSWAVSVLEMFQGEVTWKSGSAAAEALEAYIEESASANQQSEIPAMPEGIVVLLRQCFQKNPNDRPHTMRDCAMALCEEYQFAASKPFSRSEPKDIGDTADALNNRALSMLDLGKPDEAECLFDRALAIDKHHVAATYNQGLMLWRAAKCTDAIVLMSLQELRNAHPNDGVVECALGWVRMENADFAQALSNFEKALELGDDSEARIGMEQARPLAQVGDGQCLRTFEGHTKDITSVAFSPDGRFVLSSSSDETLRLWDGVTGKILRTFEGHKSVVTSVAFSPDGRFVLSGSWDDNTLWLWDVATGQCIRTFEEHMHWSHVTSVAYSPDGRFALSGSGDETIRLWDVATGEGIHKFEGHKGNVTSVAFSPDGRFVLSGSREVLDSEDHTPRLWDVTTGECLRVFEGHAEGITSVAFSPDGRFALSGSGDEVNSKDHTLRLWNVATGQCLRTFIGHTDSVESVAFSPDGHFALSGSRDATLRLWNVTTGQCLRTFMGHTFWVTSVAYSPDGRFILSGSWDKTLRLWDVSLVMEQRYVAPWVYSMVITVEDALERQSSHETHLFQAREALGAGRIAEALVFLKRARAVPGFEKSPESLELQARVGARSRVKSFNGGWLKRIFEGHSLYVYSVAFSPDGRLALSGSGDHSLRLWDVATGQCLRTFEGHTDHVISVAFSPDGHFALSGSYDMTLRLWDVITGRCLYTFEGHKCWVHSVAFSPDGRFVLSGSANNRRERDTIIKDHTLRLWDVATGKCLRTFMEHTDTVVSVAYSPDGRFVLSGSDNSIRLWDLATGQCIRTFGGHTNGVHSVAYSPDGRFALSGSENCLQLWDVATGQCLRTFEGHTNGVISVAFSPDNHFSLSGNRDNKLRLCDVATGKCLRTFAGHAIGILSVAFSPDGRFALSGSGDNTIRLWELDWEYEYDPEHDPVLKRQTQGKPGAEPNAGVL